MKNNDYKNILTLNESKERITEILLQYNYYDYKTFLTTINESSNLLVLEYRSGFQNVYQSLTIVITEVEHNSNVIIYECKTTTSLSDYFCKRKEIERIVEYLQKSNIEVLERKVI